jgi:copper chaperone
MNEERTIVVEGMTCGGCEERVSGSLQQLDGVRTAAADHQAGEVRVVFDPGETSPEAIAARVRETGYQTPA